MERFRVIARRVAVRATVRDGNYALPMSGRKKGGSDGRAPGGGGYTKSGKPRPGTGGNRRDRLEGKGPTPPAHMRTGHPAQRAAAARAAAAGRPARKARDGRARAG